MPTDGGLGLFPPLLHWLRPNPPSDARPAMSGEQKAKLRAARKRQRGARKCHRTK